MERHEVTVSDGTKLSCILKRRPKGDAHAADDTQAEEALVILVHGRLHTKSRGPMAELNLPFSILSFDARGMGESSGHTGYSNIQEEVDDLYKVVQHFSKTERILALVGHSKGAVVLLNLATQHPLPCSLLVNVSGRFDAKNLGAQSRFTKDQDALLANEGQFVWMSYRAGPEPDRSERRPYLVTAEAVEAHQKRTLDCLQTLPEGISVLNIHGKADGTVPYEQAIKIDCQINKSKATSDTILLEGVAHNYDQSNQSRLLSGLISTWISSRLEAQPVRPTQGLVDHLGQNRGGISGASTPLRQLV